MPQLSSYKTTRVILPSTQSLPADEQAWVEMRLDILVGDMDVLPTATESTDIKNGITGMIGTITRMVVDWNFTKPDGSKEDITEANIRRLDLPDFTALCSVLNPGDLSDEEKKSSSSTSQPAKTETPSE